MKSTHKPLRVLAALLSLLLLCGCGAQEAAQPTPTAAAEAAEPTIEVPDAPAETPEASAAPDPAPTPEPKAVSVSNVDELLDAIAPNTVIELAPGVYDLSSAANYGRETLSPYCSWVPSYLYNEGGFGLEIHDVTGLTLRGAGRGISILNAVPRDVFVLSFRDCDGISVEGLTAGHSPEGGVCMGSVLEFALCRDASVCGCGLFGCGTIGVYGRGCDGLSVLDTQIYECSSAAVETETCRDVRVDSSEVFQLGKSDSSAYALFHALDTDGFAVSNSAIYGNDASYLFLSYGSRNCFFLSNRVSGNLLVYGFSNYDYPCTVDGCSFTGPEGAVYAWSDPNGLSPLDLACKELSDRELSFMTFAAIDPVMLLPLREEPPAVEETITVTNADEFLAAIGPKRTILLDDEVFDLSEAQGYGSSESPYYRWVPCYDGWELVISWVSDLNIRAAGDDPAATTLVTAPRYANVLSFRGCRDVTLEGFTLGHTQAPGSCAGGVVDFRYGSGLQMDACRLYGCGVLGLNASDSRDLRLCGCEIYDCSDGGVSLYQVENAQFESCDIHDVPSPALSVFGCAYVTWNGADMDNGWYNLDREDGSLILLPDDFAYGDFSLDVLDPEALVICYQGQELGYLELREQDSVILTATGCFPYGVTAPLSSTWRCDAPESLQLSPIDGGTRCIVKALHAVEGDLTLTVSCGNFTCEIPVRIEARG